MPLALDLMGQLRESVERIEVAGSLRRQKVEVGDIELVAIPKLGLLRRETDTDIFGNQKVTDTTGSLLWLRLDGLVNRFEKRGEKYRQFQWKGVQVDFFTAERGNWGWIYLVRTGSADFSHRVAATLNGRGYTSAMGYIRKKSQSISEPIETPEEEDVFRLAGMKWVDPVHRTA